jgi:urease accessory protein
MQAEPIASNGSVSTGGEAGACASLASLLWLLQLGDSQFPSGSYAHSSGLEGLVQRGAVRSPEDLEAFVHQQVIPNLCALEMPLLKECHAAAADGDARALRGFDDALDAWKLAAELRKASRQIGSRRIELVRKLAGDRFVEAYALSGAPCHHLTACALEYRHQPFALAATAFGFQAVSGFAVAAMKLVRMGQERCQRIIRSAMVELAPRLEQACAGPTRPPAWFNPALEIASMRHAVANERLFIS